MLNIKFNYFSTPVVPFTTIEAPMTGSPSSEITFPATLEVCAETTPALIASNRSPEVNFFFINTLYKYID